MIVEWVEAEPAKDEVVLRPQISRLTWADAIGLAITTQAASPDEPHTFVRLALVQEEAVAKVLDIDTADVTMEMCAAIVPALMERASALLANVNGNSTAKN